MSTITIGSPSADLTAATGTHNSVSTDPDVFAAQLQSASATGLSLLASPAGAATVPTSALPTSALPTGGSSAATTTGAPSAAVSLPVGFAQPDGPASPPVVTPPAPIPVVHPDANTPKTAGSTTEMAEQTSSIGASQDIATSGPDDGPSAPPAADTAADTTAPSSTPGRRAPRHAVADALPAPVASISVIGLPPVQPFTGPVAVVPAVQTPDDDSVAAQAAIATGSPALAAAIAPTLAAGTELSRDRTAAPRTAAPRPVAAAPIPSLPTVVNAAPLSATAAVANVARPAVRVVATTAADPRAFAAALAQPAISHTPVATAASAPPAPTQPEPLNTQLASPLLSLRSAGSGTHVLTLTVSPESVGPVTVRAHVADGLMRVELSAPTAQGTDALHAMLPDLKRDLSQGGLNSALSISSQNSDGAAAGSQNPFGGSGGFARDDRPSYLRNAPTTPVAATASSSRPISVGANAALDVLA